MTPSVARELIGRMIARGVREFCVCAGARNVELIAPLLDEKAPVRIWHFFEERSAGFFAVGRTMVTGRPVAVVTTSGTAAAELLPAMIEAHYQGLPMLAVTADRPPTYRGSGAPQAIEQVGIFGSYAGACEDIVSKKDAAACLERWRGRGPWHLNVCQDEPDAGGGGTMTWSPGEWIPKREISQWDAEFVRERDGLVVLLGDLATNERAGLAEFLGTLGVPVAAEAGSGLREGPEIAPLMMRGGDRNLAGHPVRKVLRIGGVPSWRFWRDLESRPEIEVLSLCRTEYSGLARKSETRPLPDFTKLTPPGSGSRFEGITPDALLQDFPRSECGFVRTLSETIPEGARVFLGNSLPIREWNLAATYQERGLQCHAARGANGIEGQVSAFFGTSVDAEESWLVCGDLTAMYDLSGPWILDQLPSARRRIVVLNNGGGKIFSRLPAVRKLESGARKAVENAHGRSFEAWAAMWNLDYARVDDPAQLASPTSENTTLIEILPDTGQSEAFWEAWQRT